MSTAQVEQTNATTGLSPHPERETMEGRNKITGFWLFLGAETVMFACFFGVYLALRNSSMDGPTTQELYHIPMVAVSTLILLFSSLTSVLGVVGMQQHNYKKTMLWFGITVLLGASFLGFEIYEFVVYVGEGHTFTSSAFGSAFYTLLGTHGAHVLFGVCWITGLLAQARKQGLTQVMAPKFFVASLYWHFIDVVWVFIFTVVYLMGKVG
ncbi:heme/copper-type cytochrome/quinol oxidase subunit 3 [Kroppenstedtia sanguinis]|uniref:Cytochrome (Ubi)quinol oxidase subunit III n=1 Tax=Kroppenstedtia sanguinis TaxID=1380684 RepID=A0ABW4CBJ6_9BACL